MMRQHKRWQSIAAILLACIVTAMMTAACGAGAPSASYATEAQRDMAPAPAAMNPNTAGGGEMYDGYATDEMAQAESGTGLKSTAAPLDSRKLVKTLNLDMQTIEFDKAVAAIAALATEMGGYVEQSSVSGNNLYNDYASSYDSGYESAYYNPRYASFTLRIPADKLTPAADRLAEIGNITNRSESISDITDNYMDTERRLETLQVQEERLLELLKGATDLEAMITIEKELSNVRYEIESYTSYKMQMDKQVTYSTVNIYMNEVIKYDDVRIAPPTFGERIGDAFQSSIEAIGDVAQWLVIALVAVIPFLLVWGSVIALIVFIIVRIVRAYRKKHPKAPRVVYQPQGVYPPVPPPVPEAPKSDHPEK